MIYNIYCDESCHLEKDTIPIMTLGGMKCLKEHTKRINYQINKIKAQYGIPESAEVKWTKISPSNTDFFIALVDYFFDNNELEFRGYIAKGKHSLNHELFLQSYNEWYYKMYYRMLEYIIDTNPNNTFNIYIDIKDTVGHEKVTRIKNYLNAHAHREAINNAMLVRSHEINILQLADLFVGALSYKNRKLNENTGKVSVINRIEKRSGFKLDKRVPRGSTKANWFDWEPSKGGY